MTLPVAYWFTHLEFCAPPPPGSHTHTHRPRSGPPPSLARGGVSDIPGGHPWPPFLPMQHAPCTNCCLHLVSHPHDEGAGALQVDTFAAETATGMPCHTKPGLYV
jgi:hypothetical protein